MNYRKIYNSLVARGKKRELLEYIEHGENHHIIPRSMGGNDSKDNLVRLTYREHFLAHLLLLKIHNNSEMGYALHRMMSGRRKKEYKNSILYSIARKHHRKIVSEASKKLMSERVSVRSVETGKVHLVCKEEYRNNKHKWVGLNYGNRYELPKNKNKTAYKDKFGNNYRLDINDPLIDSLNLVGVGCTKKATESASRIKRNRPWHKKTVNCTRTEIIKLIPDLYEWYIVNKGKRNCTGSKAMVGYWRREKNIQVNSKLFITLIDNINSGWKLDNDFYEAHYETFKN